MHTYLYICIYVNVCVCVCVCRGNLKGNTFTDILVHTFGILPHKLKIEAHTLYQCNY